MTRTFDIPEVRWGSFLRMIIRGSLGRPTRIELVNRALGDQEMGDRLPLRLLELEEKGSERGHLLVSVGDDEDEVTHLIEMPTRMAIGLNDVGELLWLAVDAGEVGTTIVHFESFPALEAEYTFP
ncbi:MAG: hypothetical protein JWN44_4589 [Myxococcales bacterium]|nr:hypothetical protein [Myxococcales bacterium]